MTESIRCERTQMPRLKGTDDWIVLYSIDGGDTKIVKGDLQEIRNKILGEAAIRHPDVTYTVEFVDVPFDERFTTIVDPMHDPAGE